jgi:SPP1 gp7 family putative phage head morphogenesis protein
MRKPLVTARKKAWASRFKFNGAMRGTPLADPAGVEARYAAALERLAREMTGTVRKEIEALFRKGAAKGVGMDASPSSQARILTNALKKRFEQLFARNAKPLAEKMVGQADKASASAAHMSLKELSGGLSLKTSAITPQMREFMNAAIANNVSLIKSIASEYMVKVQGAVMRSIMDGNGLQDLVPFFEEQEGITHRRAKNIALDQTRKAYNGLNRGRMEAVGIKKFEWVHSGGGQHPRELHQRMSGNIYSFDDLPVIDENTGERGIPGQLVNCRCVMRPVIEFEEGSAE